MTNAHGLGNPAYLQVELKHKSKRYEARVVATNYEYDLALLSVYDEDFWVDTQAFEFEENFQLDESLKVLGVSWNRQSHYQSGRYFTVCSVELTSAIR